MQNTKKFSMNVLLIIISILFVFSIIFTTTGAWYTESSSASSGGTSVNFVLGTLGDIEISTGSYTWKDSAGNTVSGRSNLMPGDKLISSNITITFDKNQTATLDKAYYLIKCGGNYYTINNSNALVQATTNAGEISSGSANAKTINGSIVSITSNGTTYSLDGLTSSASIGDFAQGQNLSNLSPKIGTISYVSGSITYQVAIIQYANLTASEAYTQLISVFS